MVEKVDDDRIVLQLHTDLHGYNQVKKMTLLSMPLSLQYMRAHLREPIVAGALLSASSLISSEPLRLRRRRRDRSHINVYIRINVNVHIHVSGFVYVCAHAHGHVCIKHVHVCICMLTNHNHAARGACTDFCRRAISAATTP